MLKFQAFSELLAKILSPLLFWLALYFCRTAKDWWRNLVNVDKRSGAMSVAENVRENS